MEQITKMYRCLHRYKTITEEKLKYTKKYLVKNCNFIKIQNTGVGNTNRNSVQTDIITF